MTTVVLEVQASADDAYEHGGFLGYNDSAVSLYSGFTSGSAIDMGLRFNGVNLPAGCTIDDVSLVIYDLAFEGGTHTVDMGFEDADEPATFSSGSTPSDRTMTTARVEDGSVTEPAGTPPQPRTIAESEFSGLVASLQEVIDTHGAQTAIVLLWQGGLTSFNTWVSFDHATSPAPEITIDYTEGGGGGGDPEGNLVGGKLLGGGLLVKGVLVG